MTEVRIGLVEGAASSEKILNLFNTNNINVEPVFSKSLREREGVLEEGKVDIILHNAYKKDEYKSLYEFTGDQVYIAANKNRADILKKLDEVIEEFSIEDKSPLEELLYKEDIKAL